MLKFTLAMTEDIPRLKEVLIASFVSQSLKDYGREDVLPPGVLDGSHIDNAANSDRIMYTITVDGEIAGGIIVQEKENKVYYLQTLWLAEDYQNQKIGHSAMKFIESTHDDAKAWELETPSKAIRNRYFYEKHGYKKVGELHLEDWSVTLINYKKEMNNN